MTTWFKLHFLLLTIGQKYLDEKFSYDKEKLKKKAKKKKERFPYLMIVKWGFYTIELMALTSAFGSIYDNLRIRVQPIVHCFAYGLERRCNWGIFASFMGIMLALYSLTTSVFVEFMKIPAEMKIHETPFFLGFKFGLTFLIRRRLYKWHIDKIKRKYFTRRYHPWDLIMKMTRLGTMIGTDVRNVRQNIIQANIFQLFIILIEMYYQDPLFNWLIKYEIRKQIPRVKRKWKKRYRRHICRTLIYLEDFQGHRNFLEYRHYQRHQRYQRYRGSRRNPLVQIIGINQSRLYVPLFPYWPGSRKHFFFGKFLKEFKNEEYPFGKIEGRFFSYTLRKECRFFFRRIFFSYLRF